MLINTMTETECRAFLERTSIGRLGCSLDNQPYVVPICFAYEPDSIYIFSTLGQKIEWMRVNPKVCIQIDEIADQSRWISVVLNGRYQELTEPQYTDELLRARKLLEKRFRWWLNALAERRVTSSDDLIAPLFFRVNIDSMTGLRAVAEQAAAG